MTDFINDLRIMVPQDKTVDLKWAKRMARFDMHAYTVQDDVNDENSKDIVITWLLRDEMFEPMRRLLHLPYYVEMKDTSFTYKGLSPIHETKDEANAYEAVKDYLNDYTPETALNTYKNVWLVTAEIQDHTLNPELDNVSLVLKPYKLQGKMKDNLDILDRAAKEIQAAKTAVKAAAVAK